MPIKAAKPVNMAKPITQCGMSILAPLPTFLREPTWSGMTLAVLDRPGRARATDTIKPPHANAAPPKTEQFSSKLSTDDEPNRLNGRINLKVLFIGCSSGRE